MATPPQIDHDEIIRRISRDLADGYDEELEMEIEDRHPLPGVQPGAEDGSESAYRQDYFRQLFRLQAVRGHAGAGDLLSGRPPFIDC